MQIQRMHIPVIGALLLVVLLASTAAAQGVQRFRVKFNAVTDNCSKQTGLSLRQSTLQLSRQSANVTLEVPGLPALVGALRRGGKLKAVAETSAAGGIRRTFTASGRVQGNRIQLLLIVDFYRKADSLCTQTWNVAGTRRPARRS